jgi:diadenosine tetraphosphate (Ap4A) HIT family hydrolase
MDCAFCAEFAHSRGDRGRIIVEEVGWVLLPTVGCFVPGYSLFMPLEHVDAAADLTPAELVGVEGAVEKMRERIAAVFGPTIVAEHGSHGCRLGAGCCTHCHLHLIPVAEPDAVISAYEATGGAPAPLTGLADLPTAVDGPYLYLSTRAGQHFLWPSDARFARQFVRRVCAELHGVADQYDWRDFPFEDNQALTLGALGTNQQATC